MRRSWLSFFLAELKKPEIRQLVRNINSLYRSGDCCYPPKKDILKAFCITPAADIKAVLIGQDPYHGPGQAMGLAFSVPATVRKLPPTLKNIFREYGNDLSLGLPSSGDLTPWAENGVLLLNSILTVRPGVPLSCDCLGYRILFDDITAFLYGFDRPLVFLVWGNWVLRRLRPDSSGCHMVLASAHPSPLSAYRGFFGSRPFSKANGFLRSAGQTEINWRLS